MINVAVIARLSLKTAIATDLLAGFPWYIWNFGYTLKEFDPC